MMNVSTNDVYGFRNFIIDLVGKLMPGMLFVIFSVFSLAWPIYALTSGGEYPTLIGAAIESGPNLSLLLEAVWVSLTFFVFFLAYSIGHMFYRSDIKKPDEISLKRALADKKLLVKAKEDCACDEVKYNEFNFSCFHRGFIWLGKCKDMLVLFFYKNGDEKPNNNLYGVCEYPYPYLDEYLKQRGLDKCIEGLIPWRDGKLLYRSKNYINILKIRIAQRAPQLHMEITRNEAHVRLSSSLWYVARALQWIASLSILILLIAITMNEFYNTDTESNLNDTNEILFNEDLQDSITKNSLITMESDKGESNINKSQNKKEKNSSNVKFYLVHAIPPIMVVLISAFFRCLITGFLHQQRVREVVYILEIAHSIYKEEPSAIKDVFTEYNP